MSADERGDLREPLFNMVDPDKRPAAVVLMTRGPLVLALTRKGQIADLHLPGGKGEVTDQDLTDTAIRELREETGLSVWSQNIIPLVDYVAHTGRPVSAFLAVRVGRVPTTFDPTAAGWPGWVHPGALLTRWCTYREEAAIVLRAAAEHNDEIAMVLLDEHLSGKLP